MTHEAAHNGETPLATGPVLSQYLDETAHSTDSVSAFNNRMGRLLADRLGDPEHGAKPTGYVMATTLLTYDCEKTGISGFDHEPMPREVTGQPTMMYGLFQEESVRLARGAFGDAFANDVEAIYDALREQSPAPGGIPTVLPQALLKRMLP
jgi:hypothetical protein